MSLFAQAELSPWQYAVIIITIAAIIGGFLMLVVFARYIRLIVRAKELLFRG